ncbi:MAG TPA: hypothetical protein VFV03_06800 [Solirubrobacteraceae bacterium]|nr:hypothetical protein [Solirubrobacteraceae bacterium]
MRHTLIAALALTATALAASGCGESSGQSQAGAALIAQADAICRRVHNELVSIRPETQSETARLGAKVTAYERAAVAAMRRLVPPASLAGDWKEIVAGAQTLADDAAKITAYARASKLETKAARALISESRTLRNHLLTVATRDNFKDCSRTV